MVTFVLEIIMVVCLGFILYLFARVLPRVEDANEAPIEERMRQHWLSLAVEKADEWLTAFFEKFLRRMKVWVLKADNWVSVRLNRFKKETKELQFTEEEKKEGKEEERERQER